MNITKYIELKGDKSFAELVGCKERTAASWRRGERSPSKEQIKHIIEATNGAVSVAGCLNLEPEENAA